MEYIPARFHGMIVLKLRGCKCRTEASFWLYRLKNRRNLLVIYIRDTDAAHYLRLLDSYLLPSGG